MLILQMYQFVTHECVCDVIDIFTFLTVVNIIPFRGRESALLPGANSFLHVVVGLELGNLSFWDFLAE